MSPAFDSTRLDAAGLNLHAVFDLADLPEAILAPLAGHDPRYRQLILLGHGGRQLWEKVQASGIDSADPIDDFTLRTVREWAGQHLAGRAWEAVYPDHERPPVGLQALGQLAGWHHASPFMVGINDRWGSWFAYRAVLLADSDFAPTPPARLGSPCPSCVVRPCITRCPAPAVGDDGFALAKCVAYRQQQDSACRATCLARVACPVAEQHRYPVDQLRHCYSISMRWISRRG